MQMQKLWIKLWLIWKNFKKVDPDYPFAYDFVDKE
jgi:hypothetical protein